jgi:hypothetical protein
LNHALPTRNPGTQSHFSIAAVPDVCTDSRLLGGDHIVPLTGFTEPAPRTLDHTTIFLDESPLEYWTFSPDNVTGYDNPFDGKITRSHDSHNLLDGQSEVRWDPAALAAPVRSHCTPSCLDPAMFYTPTHLPTVMIEFWFSDVCPMWCIFDSDANYNYRFALKSWASSEPVFFAVKK